jgi:hypothetical protein
MPTSTESKGKVKVADEVWIAAALLHREQPSSVDFSIEQIVARAAKESLTSTNRPGVYVHVVQHCVANRPANPGRYRMLFETAPGRRRLYLKGDPYHPSREGAKTTPKPEDIPPRYRDLLDWYRRWSERESERVSDKDPLLALAGSGARLWSSEHADEYVRRLREGWE